MNSIEKRQPETAKRKEESNLIIGAAVGIGAIAAWLMMGRARRQVSFKDKTVVITGGSRGLGLVLARQFAREGAKLAICSRTADELERAKTELQNKGAEVFSKVCDVRDKTQVESFIADVENRYGHIDVLVNNAGVIQVGPLEVQTQKDFEDSLAVHFWGPFYTMQAALPKMRERGAGRIINISSIGGKVAVPHLAPYCAGKFALAGLSNSMRIELAKDNIFVTTVCPGLMRTGSHINALFKGRNELEYALFSISNALPFTSVSAEKAARDIVEACRRGDAEAVISVQAQMAVKANAILPELVAETSALINQIMPGEGGIGKGYALGKESDSFISPSFLTALADKESAKNNELKPGETLD